MAPTKIVFVVNAGSSSIKTATYSVQQRAEPQLIADVQITGLASQNAKLRYCRSKYRRSRDLGHVDSHDEAMSLILEALLQDEELHEIETKDDLAVICHRVVHGGTYASGKPITHDVYHHLQTLSNLAPLHNKPALSIIDSCMQTLKNATNCAYFDTQFHMTIPSHIFTYPIPQDIAEKHNLRKFGFHGLSYAYITRSCAELLGKNVRSINLIALHLGSGASVCAIKNGQSLDTSMGLTPLEGLPGGTRSGSVDPSLIFHYIQNASKDTATGETASPLSKAEEVMNKHCGWNSLTGTDDFSKIAASFDLNDQLAFDIFCNRICGYIGSYYVALQGHVDALVFAGGIGENCARLRSAVVDNVECLGFAINRLANKTETNDVVSNIAHKDSKHAVLVCKTDEQLQMVRTYSYGDNFDQHG